jgi:hypothetical protein
MTKSQLSHENSKYVRDFLNSAVLKSDQIQTMERELVEKLYEIDQKRFFVRYGYKSLTAFCCRGLRFGETQTQRLVTQVRRYEPTPNIGVEGNSKPLL